MPERYKTELELLALVGSDEPFEFFNPVTIDHSSDLKSGVTFDLNFDVAAFSDLVKEDAAWYVQHTGYADEKDFWELMAEAKRRMSPEVRPAHLRLWQWGLMNELCDRFDAVAFPIPSLKGVEKVLPEQAITAHSIREKYDGIDQYFQNVRQVVSRYILPPKDFVLTACPPLLAILLERSRDQNEVAGNLRQMRTEFRELRETQTAFMASLAAAAGIQDQKGIIQDWNSSWNSLLRSSFRKPSLLRRAVTTAEVEKSIVEMLVGKPPPLSILIDKFLNHQVDIKVYKRFRLSSGLASKLDAQEGARDKLELLFGIKEVIVAPRPLSETVT